MTAHGNAKAYAARFTDARGAVRDFGPVLGLSKAIAGAVDLSAPNPQLRGAWLKKIDARARVALALSQRSNLRVGDGRLEVWRVPEADDALHAAASEVRAAQETLPDSRVVHYRAGLRVIRHNWGLQAIDSVALDAEGLESHPARALHLIEADGMDNLLSGFAWRVGQIVNAHCAAFRYPAFSAPPECLTRDALEARLPNVRSTLSRARNDQGRATIGFPGHSRRFAHPERPDVEFTAFLDFGDEVEAAHDLADARTRSIRRVAPSSQAE